METTSVKQPARVPKPKKRRIPKELIYEMVDGKPIYYRDYKKVLTQQKTMEEIMGSSFLQAELVALLVGILVSRLDLTQYIVTTNELGFIFLPKNWRVLDIAIFERKKAKHEVLSTKYVKTPPKIVIEEDIKVDLSKHEHFLSYLTKKIEHLLNAGVEKVIWIFTDSQTVLIAEPETQWMIAKWNDTIPVIDGVSINLEELMKTIVSGEESTI